MIKYVRCKSIGSGSRACPFCMTMALCVLQKRTQLDPKQVLQASAYEDIENVLRLSLQASANCEAEEWICMLICTVKCCNMTYEPPAGKTEAHHDPGDLIAQLHYRKAAMMALKRQFEAIQARTNDSKQDLRIVNSRLDEAKTQLAKVSAN